jgi:arginase family enzyme
MEHPEWPLKPGRYSVIAAQRQSAARAHVEYVEQRRGRIHWLPARAAADWVLRAVLGEFERLATRECAILLSVDADAFHQGQVPGTSAPSPVGLEAEAWPEIALLAGARTAVRSIDLVEVNPALDRDGQTARWAALGIRQFLVGLGARGLQNK